MGVQGEVANKIDTMLNQSEESNNNVNLAPQVHLLDGTQKL